MGTIGGDLDSLHKVVRRLQSTGSTLRFVYEAGPCGYEIYRSLTNQGLDCIEVAPSLISRDGASDANRLLHQIMPPQITNPVSYLMCRLLFE
jgi:transposase